jgi:hypothetical protein
MNLSFGGFGDEILNQMRQLEVAQAVIRFGRDNEWREGLRRYWRAPCVDDNY